MLIALVRRWDELGWADPTRVAASLGLFNAGRCNSFIAERDAFFHLTAPRARPAPKWRVARSPSGWPVLFAGWFDQREQMIAALGGAGNAAADDASLYGAALECWGADTDSRITGTYAAIVPLPDGRVRLSRSPWNGMPLFYAADAQGLAVASLPRPIFAAGWPERLHEGAVARLLAFRLADDRATPFEGVYQVPSGSVAFASPGGVQLERWYDPLTLPPTLLDNDAAYVERANALLTQAVQSALSTAQAPGIQLSGGLDSAIVADEMLHALPQGVRLRSYTFHPINEAPVAVPPTLYADERAFVADFAAMHPRLAPTYVDNRGIGFDDRARALFLAGGTAFPSMVLSSPHHGCYAAAAADGSDWLFHAGMGNITFSNEAPWVWAEWFARGRWRELWRLARDRLGDQRPALRRLIAHAVMPHLAPRLRRALRRAVHPREPDNRFGNRLLRAGGPAAALADHPPSEGIATSAEMVRNRAEWLEQTYRDFGTAGELNLAYEQVFGLRMRDVVQYRPLIEFCITIPTEQLCRRGERRFLARRMAKGRMPEAQRRNPRAGMHNADWHFKMARDLDALKRRVEGLADHPMISQSIDIDTARALLEAFPTKPPVDDDSGAAWRFELPAVLMMADYVDFVSGRNTT